MQAGGYRRCSVSLFTLALLLMLVVCGVQGCWTGSGSECEKAPFVPGYNLAGEGFDIVRMRRTGAYVINVKSHLAGDRTCTLCRNSFQGGQIQKVPATVVDWRDIRQCNKHLSSALHHSVKDLLRSSTSLVNSNWDLGLSLDKTGSIVLGGSHSDLTNFARSQHRDDKAAFATQEISCTFYSYRLADHPQLSTEFRNHLQRLPQRLDTYQNRVLYRRLIGTYGTHYIYKVKLGGKMSRISAFRTCLARLKGFSESEVNNCLNIEFKISLGFLPASTSFSYKCGNLRNDRKTMDFHQSFMTHKTEVIGGHRHFPDIFDQQDLSEAYSSWMNSLHGNPDVVSYVTFPLHQLVEDPQISNNLRTTINEYIKENQLQVKQPAARYCSSSPNLDDNCCPRQNERGTLRVKIERATGLNSDPFSETDAYVKISYDGDHAETDYILDDNYPVWNDNYYFGVVEVGLKLWLELWDSDVRYDDLIGRCYSNIKSGSHSRRCNFDGGVLYFSYTVTCDTHLTGLYCGQYSPKAE